jgi:NAD(P)-dependent dehydrogenase (short-subunit alcohol dehydrogenase family)
MRSITITGSEGLIGSQLKKFFEKNDGVEVKKLDLTLGDDLTDESFVAKWFKENPTDYLVNCFGLNDHVTKDKKKHTLFDIPLESLSKYLEINVTSLFSVCREFARNNQTGAIVNFSSTHGIISPDPTLYDGFHKDIGYAVSKAGVINMTKYLAVHLAPKIRVNCIVAQGVLSNQDERFVENLSKAIPMKRMMNKTELNDLVDYLSSEKSSFVTGSIVTIDGGYTSW